MVGITRSQVIYKSVIFVIIVSVLLFLNVLTVFSVGLLIRAGTWLTVFRGPLSIIGQIRLFKPSILKTLLSSRHKQSAGVRLGTVPVTLTVTYFLSDPNTPQCSD